MESVVFVVDKNPYCLWEVDLASQSRQFLDGLDPGYFNYILDTHLRDSAESSPPEEDDSDDQRRADELRASMVLRSCLHHSLETLFTLIGAFVQAPSCPQAWIARCSTGELRNVVRRISDSDNDLFTPINLDAISWQSIASAIHSRSNPELSERQRNGRNFGGLWSRMSAEFLSQDHIDEYNSIKHGFRAAPGGFSIRIGLEHEFGVSPPEGVMQSIGHSRFGSSFFRFETTGSGRANRSIRSTRVSLNWSIETTVLLIQMTAMSIQNVVSMLRILNGTEPNQCRFDRPSDDADFEKPWQYSIGVQRLTMDPSLDISLVRNFTRDELLQEISNRQIQSGQLGNTAEPS